MNRSLSLVLLLLLGSGGLCGQQSEEPEAQPGDPSSLPAAVPDRGRSYYHYTLAHLYKEMAVAHNRQDYFARAIEEYKQAIQFDPDSAFLSAELADLYARTGRIREAVLQAEEVLQRDPSSLEARRLLGRIYLRVLGEPSGGTQRGDVLRRAIEQFEAIARLQPKDPGVRVTLGRLYRLSSDFSKAEEVLKEALALEPESEAALTTLAFLYTDASQFHAASELLEKATGRNPDPKLLAALGAAYEQGREHGKAIQAYRKALERDKDNTQFLSALGRNLIYNEQYEEALVPYQAVAAAQPRNGNAFLRLGQIYRQLRKYDLALENLRKAGALMPESVEVPYNLALLHEAQGRPHEAIQAMQKLLDQTNQADASQQGPREKANRAILLERLGVLYRSTENYTAAEEAFRQMLESDEENAVRGATQLVETLRQARELPRALAEAEAALQRFPEERSLKLTHVSLLGESGEAERASRILRAMLQDKPEDREVLLTLAQVNERAKRYREAEQAIAAAEKYSSRQEEKEFVHFLWGSILERQKKYNGAEEQFQKALAINPQSAMTLNYLGYMLADRGVRLEEAKRYIQAALEQDPNNGAYLDSLGWVFYKLDQFDAAEQYLLRAVQRISRDATIHDHLGDVYYSTGRIREALIHWQKALAQWSRALPSEADPEVVAKIQKKLEGAKVRLARETGKKRD